MKNNPRIRYACLEFDVRLWEVAEKLRMSDTKLSKMLRKKLSDIETDKMVNLIRQINLDRDF